MSFELPIIPRRSLRLLQASGTLLFLISFLLPAMYIPAAHDGSWGDTPTTASGVFCAGFSLLTLIGSVLQALRHTATAGRLPHGLGNFLAGCSGLINPLILAYAVCPLMEAQSWRRGFAIAIGFSFILGCVGLSVLSYSPLIGFFVWAAGTLLILSPEFSRRTPEPRMEEDGLG